MKSKVAFILAVFSVFLTLGSCASAEYRLISLDCEEEVIARLEKIPDTDVVRGSAVKQVVNDMRLCGHPKDPPTAKAFGFGYVLGVITWVPFLF